MESSPPMEKQQSSTPSTTTQSIIVTQQNTKALKNHTNIEEGRSTSNNPRPIPRKAPRRMRRLKELAKSDIGKLPKFQNQLLEEVAKLKEESQATFPTRDKGNQNP